MKLEAGNVQEATPLLESAVKFAPTSPLAHLNLADAYTGSVCGSADAKREFDKAVVDGLEPVGGTLRHRPCLYLFSPNIPGTTAADQIATAIKELMLRPIGACAAPSLGGDDVDELLARAQAKQADMRAAAAAPPRRLPLPASGAAPAAGSPTPAGSATAPAAKPPTPVAPPATAPERHKH